MSERRAFFSTLSLSAVSAFKLAMQLVVLPIMARILGPEAYGLVGLAVPFILLANMLSDAGMGMAVVREPRPSIQLESTIFWIALGIGLSLTGIMLAISIPLSQLFAEPELAVILAALSVIMTIGASLSIPNARVMRSRRFETFAIVEAIATILSAAAGISAALAGWGAWSLVVQQLSLWGTKLCLLFPATKFAPHLYCKLELARPYLSFGLNSVGANLTDFMAKNIAPVIIGRTLGVLAVGHYALAWQLVRVPDSIVSSPAFVSVFTSVSQAHAAGEPVDQLILKPMRILIMLLAPVYVGLALVAGPAVAVMLGEKWADTAPVLAALCPAGFLLCLLYLVAALLLGLGRADLQFRLTLFLLVMMASGAAIGSLFGLLGVGIGLSIAAVLATPVFLIVLARMLKIPPWRVAAGSGRPLFATFVMGAGVWFLGYELNDMAPLRLLPILIVAGMVLFGVSLVALCGRQVIEDISPILPERLRNVFS